MANNDITFIRPEVKAASLIWKKVRDVCRGSDAVKGGGYEYLPQLDPTNNSNENQRRNEDYRKRAVFYAITGHTLNGLIGMAFVRDPTLTLEDKMAELKTSVDGAGVSIYQQSQATLKAVLEEARRGLYVDYSSDMQSAIILDYQADDIINWRTQRINGRDKLILVVLRECVEIPDGYGYKNAIQYRELTIEEGRFVCRVWKNDLATNAGPYTVVSEYSPVKQFGGAWDEIPFTFVGAQNNDPGIDDSPLFALAEINLGHYRNSADYEDSVFFCGQIQPWISGLSEEWRDFLFSNRCGSLPPLMQITSHSIAGELVGIAGALVIITSGAIWLSLKKRGSKRLHGRARSHLIEAAMDMTTIKSLTRNALAVMAMA